MAEYIDREALLKAYLDLALAKSKAAKVRKGAAFFQGDLFPMVELTEKEWVRLINAAPTADVVEVVRCKDCKHWEDGWLGYCTKCHTAMNYDNFCSYGERRDNDATG